MKRIAIFLSCTILIISAARILFSILDGQLIQNMSGILLDFFCGAVAFVLLYLILLLNVIWEKVCPQDEEKVSVCPALRCRHSFCPERAEKGEFPAG